VIARLHELSAAGCNKALGGIEDSAPGNRGRVAMSARGIAKGAPLKRALVLIPLVVVAAGLVSANGSASEKSGVKVLCWNHHFPPPGPGSGPADIRSSPKKCSLYRDGYNYEAAGAVHMRKLHWKHWGDKTSVAKGQYIRPMDVDDPWKPIKVRLKRRVKRCGRMVYSKATFHANEFKVTFPIWIC
jgi:hypothetical protein